MVAGGEESVIGDELLECGLACVDYEDLADLLVSLGRTLRGVADDLDRLARTADLTDLVNELQRL